MKVGQSLSVAHQEAEVEHIVVLQKQKHHVIQVLLTTTDSYQTLRPLGWFYAAQSEV